MGSGDDLDLYAYVGDDPINRGDPTGLQQAPFCWVCSPNPGESKWDTYWRHVGERGDYAANHNVEARGVGIADALSFVGPEMALLTGMARTASAPAQLTQLEINKANGAAFENEVVAQKMQTDTNVQSQITVVTQSGTKTKLDILSTNSSGNIVCTECKASPTAPLTPNQKTAFPEIAQSGATVVGKGKPGYPGGTQIPPQPVDIVRKKLH